jgi:hypothetical protein
VGAHQRYQVFLPQIRNLASFEPFRQGFNQTKPEVKKGGANKLNDPSPNRTGYPQMFHLTRIMLGGCAPGYQVFPSQTPTSLDSSLFGSGSTK